MHGLRAVAAFARTRGDRPSAFLANAATQMRTALAKQPAIFLASPSSLREIEARSRRSGSPGHRLKADNVLRNSPLLILLLIATSVRAQTPASDAETFFELRIRPVLADSCFKCHGGKKVSHGLRVDSRTALLQGSHSGQTEFQRDPWQQQRYRAKGDNLEYVRML